MNGFNKRNFFIKESH